MNKVGTHTSLNEAKTSIVFILNSSFPEYSGGRENWLYHVSEKLRSMGFEIHILTMRPRGGEKPHYKLHKDINIHRANAFVQTFLGRVVTMGPLRFLRAFFVIIPFRRRLRKIIKVINLPPVVIGLDTVVTFLAVRNMLNSVYYICASKGPHAEILGKEFPRLAHRIQCVELQAYRTCDELWSNGYDMQNYILNQGFDSIMIGNGVDLQKADTVTVPPPEFNDRYEWRKVVVVGSLLEIKGINECIRAFGSALEKNVDDKIEMYFVGKGNAEAYLALRDALGLTEKIHFLGARQEVFPYMHHADVLLCTSGGGGLSMAALEALASKTPVIAWDTEVYRQMIVDNMTGYLVPYQDINGLGDKILEVLGMTAMDRIDLGQRARESVEVYGWDNLADHIRRRINQTLARRAENSYDA